MLSLFSKRLNKDQAGHIAEFLLEYILKENHLQHPFPYYVVSM